MRRRNAVIANAAHATGASPGMTMPRPTASTALPILPSAASCVIISVLVVGALAALLPFTLAQFDVPLSRAWTPLRNPTWAEAARWRGVEYGTTASFAQWYYVMLTDAQTNTTYSVGIGGFRGANESGGWLRRRTWLGVEAEPAGPPTLTVPFDHLDAAPLPAFDVRVRGPDGGDGEIGHAALQLTATSPTTLRLRVSLPPPVSLGLPPAPALRVWAWADLELTRVYGVLGTESGAEGECALSNIPFAYDSLASGSLCVAGGCGRLAEATCHNAAHCALLTGPEAAINVEATPRWRAYVESTISCGLFPRPGRLAGRPEDYPWKWMWAVSPALLDYDGGSSSSSSSSSSAIPLPPRGGRVTGEVGLVVSNARLAVPAVATQTMRIEVEVEATFAFLDVPDAAVGGSGGAPAARLGALNMSIALASRGGGVLLDTALAAALQPRGVGGGGLGLLRAASPGVGAFRRATMEHSDWARYSDVHGDVVLPLRQTLRVETDRFAAAVTYSTQPAHYVRLPFAYTAAPEAGDDSGAPPVRRTVSDMRAAASSAYVRIAARGAEAGCSGGSLGASAASSRDCVCAPDWDACASSPQAGADAEHARLPPEFGTLLVQGYFAHNALEFAYEAPFAELSTS